MTTAACPLDDTSHQDIEIELELPSRSNLEKSHWHRKDIVDNQREAVRKGLKKLAVRPRLPCTIRMIRVAPHLLDDDNVRGALKAPRDEIARWLGLKSDRDRRVRWRYGQQKNPMQKPGFQALRLIMTEGQSNCECCGAPTVDGRYV